MVVTTKKMENNEAIHTETKKVATILPIRKGRIKGTIQRRNDPTG